MDQTMQIDELRRELRHIKSRRDTYMTLVTDLRRERAMIESRHAETVDNLKRTINSQLETIARLTADCDKLREAQTNMKVPGIVRPL